MSRRDRSHKIFEFLCGAVLFIAPSAFVLWQNTHLTVLWDLSYILENATRIALGQLPYRDFPFPYAPVTFLTQAAIIKLFGRVILHHFLYAALLAGAASLLTWRILLRVLEGSGLPARRTAFLLSLPLIFLGIGSIFPHPFYDSDCTVFILFLAWLLLRLEAAKFPALPTFLCGALLVTPLFIKQNTGLAFVASATVCILWLGLRHRRAAALLLAGSVAGITLALAIIQRTVGLAAYLHWTIQFASSRRLPAWATMLEAYSDRALLWPAIAFLCGVTLLLIPHRRHGMCWLGVALLSWPFLAAVAALWLEDNASERVEALLRLWPLLLVVAPLLALWQLRRGPSIARLLPLALCGTIQGAFLSQQLWGSTYALWPMLMILLASVLVSLAPEPDSSDVKSVLPLSAFTLPLCASLLIAGGYYALSHERLEYVDLAGEEMEHSKLPALRGLAMRGSWLPDFEELVAYTDHEIPHDDAILLIPGEDLFYFTTGRTPHFPVIMMDNTVNPYSAAQLAALAKQRDVRWVVVKRQLQLQEQPIPFRNQLLDMLSSDFEPTESLNNYDIYRRKELR
jgi:hypothetical protein